MQLKSKISSVDLMFRAFSDRTRLRILNMLQDGDVCVCDLVTVIDAPQPKISRHLAYLRRAGLVVGRKDGLWTHYTLAPAKAAFHKKLLECLENCFHDVSELSEDVELLKKIKQRKVVCCS
jgi:ArsR family transcriptional regulator